MPRAAYADDPTLFERVLALVDAAIPGVAVAARLARRAGMRWDRGSTPFLRHEGGRIVAHVGVLELPLVLDGRRVTAAGIHAVATHPDHRGRGHFRAVLEEALEWAAARHETLLLTARDPAPYAPWGLRHVQEHRFVAALGGAGASHGTRRLRAEDVRDRALLHALLREREPVSHVCGVVAEKDVFLFDTVHLPLRYSRELDAALVWQVHGADLHLLDVVAPRMPSLREILARVDEPFERVVVYFAPDRLDADLAPQPVVLGGRDHLLVRGPFAPEGRPFMLPLTARC